MIGVVHTYSLLERHSSFNVIRWSQYPKIKTKNGCILFGHENSMYVQCAIHRRIRICPFIISIILDFFWKKNRNYLEFVCVVSFLIVFKFFLHFIFGIPIRLFGRLKRSIPNRITSMQIVSFHCRLSNFFFKTETETEKAQAPV